MHTTRQTLTSMPNHFTHAKIITTSSLFVCLENHHIRTSFNYELLIVSCHFSRGYIISIYLAFCNKTAPAHKTCTRPKTLVTHSSRRNGHLRNVCSVCMLCCRPHSRDSKCTYTSSHAHTRQHSNSHMYICICILHKPNTAITHSPRTLSGRIIPRGTRRWWAWWLMSLLFCGPNCTRTGFLPERLQLGEKHTRARQHNTNNTILKLSQTAAVADRDTDPGSLGSGCLIGQITSLDWRVSGCDFRGRRRDAGGFSGFLPGFSGVHTNNERFVWLCVSSVAYRFCARNRRTYVVELGGKLCFSNVSHPYCKQMYNPKLAKSTFPAESGISLQIVCILSDCPKTKAVDRHYSGQSVSLFRYILILLGMSERWISHRFSRSWTSFIIYFGNAA